MDDEATVSRVWLDGWVGGWVGGRTLGQEAEVGEEVERVGGRLVDDADDDLARIGELAEEEADGLGHERVKTWVERVGGWVGGRVG